MEAKLLLRQQILERRTLDERPVQVDVRPPGQPVARAWAIGEAGTELPGEPRVRKAEGGQQVSAILVEHVAAELDRVEAHAGMISGELRDELWFVHQATSVVSTGFLVDSGPEKSWDNTT